MELKDFWIAIVASAENLMRLFETFVLIVVGSIANHEMGKKSLFCLPSIWYIMLQNKWAHFEALQVRPHLIIFLS